MHTSVYWCPRVRITPQFGGGIYIGKTNWSNVPGLALHKCLKMFTFERCVVKNIEIRSSIVSTVEPPRSGQSRPNSVRISE